MTEPHVRGRRPAAFPGDWARRLDGLALAALPVALFVVLGGTSEDFRHQARVVLGQDPLRYSDHAAIVTGVGWDLLFVVVFGVSGVAAVRISRPLLAPFRRCRTHVPPDGDEDTGTRGPARRWVDGGLWWHGGWWIVGAAVLDVVEDLLLVVASARPPTWFAETVAIVGWLKVAAYVMAVVVLVVVPVGTSLGLLGNLVAEPVFAVLASKVSHASPSTAPPSPAPLTVGDEPAPTGTPAGIAICVSGGGIRAASVAHGALRRLDRDPTEGPGGTKTVFAAADHLCSVSGGGYVAGGWRISRQQSDTSAPPVATGATAARDGLFDASTPWSRWVGEHHRYLRNPWGGLLGGVAQAVVRIVVVTGSVVGLTAWLGVLVGWYMRSPYGVRRTDTHGSGQIVPVVVSGIPRLTHRLLEPYLVVRWWGPAAVLVVAGVALWIAGPGRPRRLALVAWRSAAVLLVALFVLPLLVGAGPSLFAWAVSLVTPVATDTSHDTGFWSTVVTLGSVLGIGSAAVGLLTRRLQRLWLRLGGVLLAVLLSVLLIAVARDVARASGFLHFGGWGWWLVAAALLVAVAGLWDAHRLTLAGLYRKRLAGTFATSSTDPGATATPIDYGHELAWSALAGAGGPSLVVAATVHSSRNTVSGLKGCGLTFQHDRIRMFNGPGGGAVDTAAYPTGSFWRGWPRNWSVSRSMAISGAAVASAMGRANLGTTNAVVAAFNLRLGMWLPNPARMDVFMTPDGVDLQPWQQPRVGYSYLLKELFGRYDLEHDPFVYVADGGHRENLGLVEALRLRPADVISIDASGDPPGSFTTLQQALDLAVLELGVVVEMQWADIVTTAPADGAPEPALPAGAAAVGEIRYPDGATGRLLYGRYQLSERTPEPLRRFAAIHPGFPYYSTADQLLDDDAQRHLVAMGEHVGDELLALW